MVVILTHENKLIITSLMYVLILIPGLAMSEEVNPHIRTLASSCAICHGTQPGNQDVMPSLAGLDADYFSNKMKEYKSSNNQQNVMVQHAKGLTEVEIEQLAIFFSNESKVCNYFKQHPQHPDQQSWTK